MSFQKGDEVVVVGHSSTWDGTTGKVTGVKIGRMIQIEIIYSKIIGGTGKLSVFTEDKLKLLTLVVPSTRTTQFQKGDYVEVRGWGIGIYDGLQGTVRIPNRDENDVVLIRAEQNYYQRDGSYLCRKGDSLGFPAKYLRLVVRGFELERVKLKQVKLKLKSCGHTVQIIETDGPNIRFKVIESKSESDWVLKTEFDKECIEVEV